jgi:hypothetical protein
LTTLLFTKVLEKAARSGNPRFGSMELRDFLRDKAMSAISRNVNSKRFINTKKAKANVVTQIKPGTVVCYFYDAKHKATLPYYDKFPMGFVIDVQKDYNLFLNLHYLPPIFRARLMDALYDLLNNQKYDDTTRLKMSYNILKGAAKLKYFKPCIKKHLHSRIQSQMVQIDVKEWDYALFLPTARFVGANQRKVWDDSIKIINKT